MSAHTPVMLKEVLEYLSPLAGKTYVDCTFGAGGYTKGIIEKDAARVYAIDCDPDTQAFLKQMPKEIQSKVTFVLGNFAEMNSLLASKGVRKVDGIVMDLGVSSMQLDIAERGFSFNKDARLDMRMSKSGYSAYEFINQSDERTLSNVIYKYGDEKNSRKIAKNIVTARTLKPIVTTTELADIVRSSFLYARGKIDLATKTFQAIRIFINNELDNLKQALETTEKFLDKGGRLVVVTFHSLEDTIVKQFIKERSSAPSNPSRYAFEVDAPLPIALSFKNLTKKAVEPSYAEVKANPRARSAKLRAIERIL